MASILQLPPPLELAIGLLSPAEQSHAQEMCIRDRNGICYEPMKSSYKLMLPAATSTTKTAAVATAAATLGPVSYTHLDVYKRQR